MTDDTSAPSVADEPPRPGVGALGPVTLYRLCEELIALREHNSRQHKLFEQALTKARDALTSGFGQFATDTTRAYQTLREELSGERRVSQAFGSELLDLALDLERLATGRPDAGDVEAIRGWAEAVAVAARKAQAGLDRLGVVRYDASVGEPYSPALHERVGDRPAEAGGETGRVAEQVEPGFASQHAGFVLRRPKVLVTV